MRIITREIGFYNDEEIGESDRRRGGVGLESPPEKESENCKQERFSGVKPNPCSAAETEREIIDEILTLLLIFPVEPALCKMQELWLY